LVELSTWFFFMTFYHVFLSWLSIKVKRSSCFSSCFSLCFSSCFSSCFSLCFSLWLSIKWSSCFLFIIFYQKDNAKVEKISIFNSLDVKLEFLTSWVELIQFSVESSCIKLKICVIWLESSWKCEQLDFESSWIQNVNSKLNSIISLDKKYQQIVLA